MNDARAQMDRQGGFGMQRSASGTRRDPRIYNVHPGECMKCGQPGHSMRQMDVCKMAPVAITEGPCPRCKRGGHLDEHCQMLYPPVNAPKN